MRRIFLRRFPILALLTNAGLFVRFLGHAEEFTLSAGLGFEYVFLSLGPIVGTLVCFLVEKPREISVLEIPRGEPPLIH